MINKLTKSISAIYNKWGTLDTGDKFYYFLTGLWSIYIGINLIFLAQYIWCIYQ